MGWTPQPSSNPAAVTYRPVIVLVAQLVGKALHVVRLQPPTVVHNIVVSGGDRSLSHRLADNEEVVPKGKQMMASM